MTKPKNVCGARKRSHNPDHEKTCHCEECTCSRPAGWGTDHTGEGTCKLHGGSIRKNADAFRRQKVEREARAVLERRGYEPVEDPITELSHIAGQAVELKEIFGAEVAKLKSLTYHDVQAREDLKAVLHAYERNLGQCHRILADMVKLDLEAKRIRLNQLQAQLLLQVANRTFAVLNLTPEQMELAKVTLATELQKVSRG